MIKWILYALLACTATGWAQTTPVVSYTPAMQPLMATGQTQPGLRPLPQGLATNNNRLTLKNAALYAMQHNSDLHVALLTHRINRTNLVTAKQKFRPQPALAPNASITQSSGTEQANNVQTNINIGPTVDWLLPEGTDISAGVAYNPNHSTGSGWNQEVSWQVEIKQPLLRGFGFAVNQAGLKQAQNAQIQDNITLQKTISQTLSTVITDYYAVVKAQVSLSIAQRTLGNNKHETFVNQQKFLAGRVAHMEVIQAKLDVATSQQSVTQAQQTLQNAKLKLLDDLGLPWNTEFSVDDHITLTQYQPDLAHCQQLALAQNRDLLIQQLAIKNDTLNITTAKDALRWQLDLDANSQQQVEDAATSSSVNLTPSNTINRNNTVTLDLTIPFNQTTQKSQFASAALQLEEDKTKLAYLHRQIINQIQTDIINLDSQWQSIKISEQQLQLAKQNAEAAKVKLRYGKINAFELSQQKQQLINDENNLVNAKIDYIQQVATFEQYIGELLKRWHIDIKAPKLDE